jgi:hypothetical protein
MVKIPIKNYDLTSTKVHTQLNLFIRLGEQLHKRNCLLLALASSPHIVAHSLPH